MGWERWGKSGERVLRAPILRESFYIFTLTLLSLLLPLSFLLLARFSIAIYLLNITPSPPSQPFSFLSLFLYTNPTLLHFLVSFVSVTALLQGLISRVTLLNGSSSPILQPLPYMAWIFLCTLQVCVGLGIEGTLDAGIWPVDYGVRYKSTILSRIIFFIGLHDTMLHWSRTIVRPVVDDTIFGVMRDECWMERVAMGACFGGLWWWMLRDEIQGLMVVVEVKKSLLMGLGVSDLVNWWLYYLTVTIGIVKLVKCLVLIGKVLLCSRRVERSPRCFYGDVDKV